jgi:hypothetical protein
MSMESRTGARRPGGVVQRWQKEGEEACSTARAMPGLRISV